MAFNPDIHRRRSIRLPSFDYRTSGAYFVTVCIQNREPLFGEIVEGRVQLFEAGEMVQQIWDNIPEWYLGIHVDVSITMPNHFHGIVLVGAAPSGRPPFAPCGHPKGEGQAQGLEKKGQAQGPEKKGQAQGPAPTLSLSDVMHRFKSLTTANYRKNVLTRNWPPFPGRLWQRNYYERIIRDDDELFAYRDYIQANPSKWNDDEENPRHVKR
jgi:putative transposase